MPRFAAVFTTRLAVRPSHAASARLVVALVLLASAAAPPTGRAAGPPPVKILFDSDMGSDCDDAGALALLHTLADEGKAEIVACVYSSGRVPYGAAVMEAINVYYGRPEIPVGAAHDDVVGDPVDKMTAEKLARDQAAFGNRIVHNSDATEQTRLCRRLLADERDRSVTYLTVGHTKGLHDLLLSAPDEISPLSGSELIERKVLRWVALGALGAANDEGRRTKDWNFFFNDTAPFTEVLVERFPRPVVFVDAGQDVLTGASLAHTPPGSIVRTAYREWLWSYEQKTLEDQRPSWDLVAALFAVEGLGAFLEDAGEGHLDVDAKAGCRWEAGPGPADHAFVRQKPGVAEALAAYLNERIARPPAVPGSP